MDIDLSMLLGQPSEDERSRQLADALERRRQVATLATLTGHPAASRFGGAVLEDVGRQENTLAEGQGKRLAAALAALKDSALQKERAVDNDRQERGLKETERFHQWQMDNPTLQPVTAQGGQIVGFDPRHGTTRSVPGPGGGEPLQANKPLQEADSKRLEEMTQELGSLRRLRSSFKPEYAGGGPIGRALTTGAQFLGALAPEKAKGVAPQLSRESANFWAEWDRMVTLPQRNKLFGASLTPSEQGSFEAAQTVKPGSDPKDIEKAAAQMEQIIASRRGNLSGALSSEGYNPGAIQRLTQMPAGGRKRIGTARGPKGERVAVYDDGSMGD
jgi:hypothetical protein